MARQKADVPAIVGRLDRIGVEFNEERLISDAGLLLTATLADRLGVQEPGQRVGVAALWDAWRGAAGPQGDDPGARDARRGGQHR